MEGDRPGPAPVLTPDECRTDWEWRYHLYRVHERRWDRRYDDAGYRTLLELVEESNPRKARATYRQRGRLDAIDEGDVGRAAEVHRTLVEDGGLFGEEPPVFEDAYHAGLYVATSRHVGEDVDDYYRGERIDGRSLRPSLYHGVDYLDPGPGDEALVDDRLRNLGRFVDRLEATSELPTGAYTAADLVAIAQHYRWALSDDAPPVGTWLLDVTSNPFTALLFATYSAKRTRGDVGIVYQFDFDWLDDEFPVGANFRPVAPAGIPRIERQDATFLEMHPEFLNQFVSGRIRFEQHPDVRFEDPYLGITARRMFPDEDRLRRKLRSERLGPPVTGPSPGALAFETVDEPPRSDVSPPFDRFLDVPPTYDLLVERIYADLGGDVSALDRAGRERLWYLGRFHAYLQRRLPERATPRSSINRLRDAVGDFVAGDRSVRGALESGYANKLAPDFTVAALMEDLERDWAVPVSLVGGA